MQRRNFLIGVSGTAAAGSALLGTGAFSRVESQRDVTIQVAEDPDAYLGLSGTDSINSDNYVDLDENGHLAIDISDNPNGGMGVNSDSFTWFDGMVRVCNQGKEGVGFYIAEPDDEDFPDGVDATGPSGTRYEDEPRLQFYTGEASGIGDDGTQSVMGEDNAVDIPVGECIELGVRTMTKGVDATTDDPLFGDEVVIVADVDVEQELDPAEPDPLLTADADDETDGTATLSAVSSRGQTTFTVEFDDDDEWPQPDGYTGGQDGNWQVEFSFRLDDNDPVDAYRIGWYGPRGLEDQGRIDDIQDEGYARINFGDVTGDGSDDRADFALDGEVGGISATANPDRSSFSFTIDWTNVTLDANALGEGDTDVEAGDLPAREISSVPSEVEINELFSFSVPLGRTYFAEGAGLTIDPSS